MHEYEFKLEFTPCFIAASDFNVRVSAYEAIRERELACGEDYSYIIEDSLGYDITSQVASADEVVGIAVLSQDAASAFSEAGLKIKSWEDTDIQLGMFYSAIEDARKRPENGTLASDFLALIGAIRDTAAQIRRYAIMKLGLMH